MSTTFEKKPLCEACGSKPATSFAYFDDNPPGMRWMFCCKCNDEKQDDHLPIEEFLASPVAMVDSLIQLNAKPWIKWPEFMEMLKRFRSEARGDRRPSNG